MLDSTVLRQKLKELEEQAKSVQEQKESADTREKNLQSELAKAKESASKAESVLSSKNGGSKIADNMPSVLSYQADVIADDLTPQNVLQHAIDLVPTLPMQESKAANIAYVARNSMALKKQI